MREHGDQATEAQVRALRQLRAPWASMAAMERHVAITTADGSTVLRSVKRAEVERVLEASRL